MPDPRLWLNESDKHRLALYNENHLLYDGKYDKVWKSLKMPDHQQFPTIVMNDARNITDAIANLLFREAPDFKAESVPEAQPHLDRLVRQTNYNSLLKEQATWGSVYGDMVFLVRLEQGMVKIEFVDPKFFFGEFDPFNVNKLLRVNLVYPLRNSDRGNISHVYRQVHRPEVILHELWVADNETLIQQIPLGQRSETSHLVPVEETGVPRLLVVHAKNHKSPTQAYGASDYTFSLKTKFRARSALMTQFDMVRAKHSNPKLALPMSIINSLRDEKSGRVVVNKDDFNLVGLEKGEDAKMITWDGELKVSLSEDDKLLQQILDEAKVSPALLGRSTSNSIEGGETGRANIMKFQSSLGLAHTKQQLLEPAIRETLLVAQLLENTVRSGADGYEPTEVKVVFKDGLPGDEPTHIQGIDVRLSNGTLSRKDAIVRLDGTTDAEAKRMVDEIDEDGSFNPDPFLSPDSA